MTGFFRKYRFDLLLWAAIVLTYFGSRLVNLGIIPIFTDEAIYLRWSQIMAYDASLRYLPLVDGKPPLFMWLTSLVIKVLPHLDILLTGRAVAVMAGFSALTGVYFLSDTLFKSKKISYLASLFYLVAPAAFFYDRFGLADSLLTAIGIWSLALGVRLFRQPRLDLALLLGFSIGLGFLTKSPALFFLAFLPVMLVLFDFKKPGWKIRLIKLAGAMVLVIFLSQTIYSILRLFPLFYVINNKNAEFTLPLKQFLTNPFLVFWGNLPSLLSWEFWYLTPLVALAAVFGGLLGVTQRHFRQVVVLTGFFVLPVLAIAFYNTRIYPRYLLPFTPVIFILAALALSQVKNIRLLIIACLLTILFPLCINFKLVTDPVNAPFLQADRDQYLDGWPAGSGIKEVRNYLTQQSKLNQKLFIATEGTFGLMPYALELYQKDYPNAQIKSYWPLPEKPPAEIVAAAKIEPTYLLMYQNQKTPPDWKLREILRFRQGHSSDYLRLYQVLP